MNPELQAIKNKILAKNFADINFNSELINTVDTETGESVVYWLLHTNEGCKLLDDNKAVLAFMINPTTLNAIILQGRHQGYSVAFALACRIPWILKANANPLGSMISANTLNTIIPHGKYAGWSVAFALAHHKLGLDLLAANANSLGSMISANTLNTIIPQGKYTGWSVAFALAHHQLGLDLLTANANALGSMINTATLNAIIPLGEYAGCSVAYYLALFFPELLAANDSALGSMISEGTLNQMISDTDEYGYGKSVASHLCTPFSCDKNSCRAVLLANNARLFLSITPMLFVKILVNNHPFTLEHVPAAVIQQYLDANIKYFIDRNSNIRFEDLMALVDFFSIYCQGSETLKELTLYCVAQCKILRSFITINEEHIEKQCRRSLRDGADDSDDEISTKEDVRRHYDKRRRMFMS